MKNVIFEEIKRIKEIMLISEATPPQRGLVGYLIDSLGFFDDMSKKVDNVFTATNPETRNLRYDLEDIFRTNNLNTAGTGGLTVGQLVKRISQFKDPAATSDLLTLLLKNPNIEKEAANFIKNNEDLLKNISMIDQNVLKQQLLGVGFDSNTVSDIVKSYYKKPGELANLFKDWKVDWQKLGGLRGEFAQGVENLDVDKAFKSKYKQIINDEAWMTNQIKNLSSKIKNKTPEEMMSYLDAQMAKYLEELTQLQKEGKLSPKQSNLILAWWKFVKNEKTFADKQAGWWRKSYTTILHFYLGVLLPLAGIIEGGKYAFKTNEELENEWLKTPEGEAAYESVINGDLSKVDFYKKFNWWKWTNLGGDIFDSSTIIPLFLGDAFKVAVNKPNPARTTVGDPEKKAGDDFEKLKKRQERESQQSSDTYENTIGDFKKWMTKKGYQGEPSEDKIAGGFTLNGVNYQLTPDKKGFN